MRESLGDGYTEALRKAWNNIVPDSADFVMYWWRNAADILKNKKTQRFGFITTNSIYQTFNRRVLEEVLGNEEQPIYLAYAIPDHPWIDSADAAAVRIAMTVASCGKDEGVFSKVIGEDTGTDGEITVNLSTTKGRITPDLQIGADLAACGPLIANSRICSTGLILGGRGFVITSKEALKFSENSDFAASLIHPLWSGRDIAEAPRSNYVIDTHGVSEDELREKAPAIWQHLYNTVFPERSTNRDPKLSKYWWLFRRANTEVRSAIKELQRFILTPETSKYRLFVMANHGNMPEHGIVAIGTDCFSVYGILSSQIHEIWSLRSGGLLGPTPRYNKTRCFETFPFPALEEGLLKHCIRDMGERLDAHRKRQQELHPGLTLTGMYNVLEKIRAGETLNAKEKTIHDQGLITLLQQLHDELDAAVLEAYGWSDLHPINATNESELLTRLVALNHTRAVEEKSGLIRWLRPEYQNPTQQQATQTTLAGTETPSSLKTKNLKLATLTWPEKLPEQVTLVRQLLTTNPAATPEELSNHFGRKNQKRVDQIEGIIETLKGLGQV